MFRAASQNSPFSKRAHARKQIEQGQRHEDVAALFNVNRSTLYRALEA
jgi:hypothetical protein